MKSENTSHPMRLIRRRLLGVLVAAVFFGTTGFVTAQPQQSLLPAQNAETSRQRPEAAPAAGDESAESGQAAAITQKKALELARARFPGTVISINEVRARNAPMRYRIRMDNEGNIFTVLVDSRSGAVTRE